MASTHDQAERLILLLTSTETLLPSLLVR